MAERNFRLNIFRDYLLLLLLIIFVHETESLSDASRIFGGNGIKINQAPFMVLIQATDLVIEKTCSGAIISEEWVLTASHCIITKQLNQIKIMAGIDDLAAQSKEVQTRNPTRIVHHPMCNLLSILEWDLALLQVPKFEMGENIGTLALGRDRWPQNELMYRRECMIIGWGLADNFATNNTRLYWADVLAEHGVEACKCLNSNQKKRAVCMVSEDGKGICAGDSGGPIICNKRGYGVAHVIYDLSSCNRYSIQKDAVCGSFSTISVFTFLCPELDWVNRYVPSVPTTPASCSANKLSSYLSSVLLLLIVCFSNKTI